MNVEFDMGNIYSVTDSDSQHCDSTGKSPKSQKSYQNEGNCVQFGTSRMACCAHMQNENDKNDEKVQTSVQYQEKDNKSKKEQKNQQKCEKTFEFLIFLLFARQREQQHQFFEQQLLQQSVFIQLV